MNNGLIFFGIMIVIAGLIIWRRSRAMFRPIKGSGIKILLPILYLSPVISVFMELSPQLKVWEVCVASLIGIVLSIPLVLTTNYEVRQDGQIYAQKSKMFFVALIGIVIIRFAARQYLSGMEPASVSMLFFTVAFSYVVPWRIASFVKFRKLKETQPLDKPARPVNI